MVDASTAILTLVSLACKLLWRLARLANILARASVSYVVPLSEAVVPDHLRQGFILSLSSQSSVFVFFYNAICAERLVSFLFLLVNEDIADLFLVTTHDLSGIFVKEHVSLTLVDVMRVLTGYAGTFSLRINRALLGYYLRSQLLLTQRSFICNELLPVEDRGLIQQYLIDLWSNKSLVHALTQDLHALDLLSQVLWCKSWQLSPLLLVLSDLVP